MQDTTIDDPLHLATVLSPGEIYRTPYFRIHNTSNTFDMHVQLVDEVNFTSYRTFTPGQGFHAFNILDDDVKRV
jgi:hypothetical protein